MSDSTNGRLARWQLLLQGYRYNIVYKKGKLNNANALSRLTREARSQQDPKKVNSQSVNIKAKKINSVTIQKSKTKN